MPDPTEFQEKMVVGSAVPNVPTFPKDEYGCIRVGGSRVPLDVVLGEHASGKTAQEIVRAYPTLRLSDIEAAISYYAHNREVVERYLETRREQANQLRDEIEASRVGRPDLLATLKARRGPTG